MKMRNLSLGDRHQCSMSRKRLGDMSDRELLEELELSKHHGRRSGDLRRMKECLDECGRRDSE